MSKMGEELERRLDENKYGLYAVCRELIERNRLGYTLTLDRIKQALAKIEGK